MLTPLGRERQLAAANFAGVPVSIALNFLLDSKYGASGASLSILFAEIVILVLQMFWSRDVLKKIAMIKDVARICLSNLIASFGAYSIVSMFIADESWSFSLIGLCIFVPLDLLLTFLLRDPTSRMLCNGLMLKLQRK